MKARWICLIALLVFISISLSGCSPLVEDIPQKKTVYATFYPVYALAAAIADGAENFDLQCLVQPLDGCIRSYDLSDWDLYMLAYSADAVLSAGNGLESFSRQLRKLGETAVPVAEVMYALEHYQMEEPNDAMHFSGTNPHLYMSVEGAVAIVENIAGAMRLFDESNAEIYEENLGKIQANLHDLKDKINKETEVCVNIPAFIMNETLYYPAADCNLEIVGHCVRENSEMLYGDSLESALDELIETGAKVVLIEKQAPYELVEALENAGCSVAKLDTMSTLSEIDGAEAYFDTLIENAKAIAVACSAIKE